MITSTSRNNKIEFPDWTRQRLDPDIKPLLEKQRQEYSPSSYQQKRSKLWTAIVVITISYSLLGGISLFLLWMNGTIGASSSTTDYQSNPVGIALIVVLGFLSLVFTLLAVLWYLVATSSPTFTLGEIESIIHNGVKQFNESILPLTNDTEILNQAKEHFAEWIVKHRSTTNEELIEYMKLELLLDYLYLRFQEVMPRLIIPDARWAYNEVGGVFARQRIILVNFTEYLDLWGTAQAVSGFSGYYSRLNEGDVIITGAVTSSGPESKLCKPCTYRFGDTSHLKNRERRFYTAIANTYMLSYALHKNSNILKTIWTGIFIPYLFFNNDTTSFWIQIGDAWKGIKLWLRYRLNGES